MSKESKIAISLCNCAKTLHSKLNFKQIKKSLVERSDTSCLVKEYDVLCTGDDLSFLVSEVKDKGIEKVIIGACSPKLYEELFKSKLRQSGINKNLIAICNIREQCAWVFDNSATATKRALSLIKGAVEKIKKSQPILEDEILPHQEVLIIGGGIGGIQTGVELKKSGIKATIVERKKELGGNTKKLNSFYQSKIPPHEFIEKKLKEIKGEDGTEILTEAEILSLKGSCGDFRARIKINNNITEKRFGAVVVATGFETHFSEDSYNLKLNEKVITQLELERILQNQEEADRIFGRGEDIKVLFITGMTKRFSKLSTGTALKNSLLLREKYNNKVFIACRNVIVAGEGLESLYGKIRDEGVIIFKFEDKKPQFSLKGNQIFTLIYDYYLSSQASQELLNPVIKIPCDILVLEEELIPSTGHEGLKTILGIDFDPLNFFQENNVHYFPVESNRKGIFFVGSCRGIEEVSDVIADAKSASVEIFELLKGKIKFPKERIIVDKGKCTLCLTCQRLCPHSAITYTRSAEISEITCQACGVCVSECPNSAITLRTFTDEDIIAEIEGYVL